MIETPRPPFSRQLLGGLAPLDPVIEAVLLGNAAVVGSLPVTLVLGLPGSDLAHVASGICAALPEGTQVALIPGGWVSGRV